MKKTSATHRTGLFINRMWICALLALIAPVAAMAQQTVFLDTFGSSTLNQTNLAGNLTPPGGTASAVTPFSATSYTIGSAKSGLGTTIASGHLQLIQGGTSSGNLEAQAVFTKYPVSLVATNDYIELTYTFTDTTNIYNGFGAAASGLFCGLFNSGGVAPQTGTNLANSGFSTSLINADTGGTVNWVGYLTEMYSGSGWRIYNRVAQTAANNNNQQLLYNWPTAGANGGSIVPTVTNLTIGTQYTIQLRITKSSATQLIVSNALYTGVGTGGALYTNTSWTVPAASVLTTNIDALSIGYRAGDTLVTHLPWTNDINQITVVANLAANQAGPYFFVSSTGDPCSGGIHITLSGSVTTNTYLLYTNGVNSGVSLAGTGTALDFGNQTFPATYTIIASNTVTTSTGLMYGSASVFAAGVTIGTQPSSVTVVSNLPASFTVNAIGASLSYQWYKNGIPLTNNANISGAQTATLNIAATGAGDAATSLNGYTVVAFTPCGNFATSAPPVSLTLTQPRNLVWAGNNPFSAWDYTADQEFTLGGSPTSFSAGDNATFDNTSGNTTVTISNAVTSSLISVVGSQSYTFAGPNILTGVSRLAIGGSATLNIINNGDNFTGGTVVSNGATLSIGNGTGVAGNLTGTVTLSPNGTLNYSSAASSINTTINMLNGFAGSGTININDASGATYATAPSLVVNSNFTGTINIQGFTALHASSGNAGYALGNASTVNVPDNAQVWLDPSATAYNNTFNIGGTGWQGVVAPALATGALRVFACTVNGPINLQDNARIGGTINGGTIQSVISGPYQLEIVGTTNSFVLIMGPTNGLPEAYASTLITAGSIQAANNNGNSSGPQTLDSGGDMRLFGNNITVSNLSSINSGQVLLIEGPRVRNMNTTNSATLTVGTDNSSTTFAGTFSDGPTATNATLGLTKVGSGILTLTLPSTNTGAITVNGGTIAMSGSGLFAKASQIIVNNGGFYDVTAAGGTLTLNSGQTLRGSSGTVNGILLASAGSVVAPGFPMATLTNSGNATVNGTYRPNLDRNSSPNSSQFQSSGGSITFSGATLNVTNVGLKLQVGDTFQLFPSGTAGFTTIALQTIDVPNNAVYTWNTNVTTLGSISVASVTFNINPNPTNIVTSVTNFINGVTNGLVTLSWPADHTGWTLQSQTNSLNVGLGTNWADVAGSAATNKVIVPIIRTNATVFYRMRF